ncbi:MAG TPA: hypothetical protein VFX16_22975 [Pseudonocardiaceae bacterium]|nr:hypothetical protein [Pseudonocardiaceae bacterium]
MLWHLYGTDLTNVDHLEDLMSTGLIIVIVIVVVLVVAALIVLPGRIRSRRLRTRFGPEYDRVVADSDHPKDAERELAERESRHSKYELRELSETARQEYLARWSTIQEQFVDAPTQAVEAADHLVAEVMADMGYPTEGFDQQADDLSVRYAEDVELYRRAHALATAGDSAGTDNLRNALLDYRELVRSLLGEADTTKAETRTERESERETGREAMTEHEPVTEPDTDAEAQATTESEAARAGRE